MTRGSPTAPPPSTASSNASRTLAACLACKNPHWLLGLRNHALLPSPSLILGKRKLGDETSHQILFLRPRICKLQLYGGICSLTTLPILCFSQEDGCTLLKVSHSLNLGQTLKQIWASLLPQEETWFLHELDVKISRA